MLDSRTTIGQKMNQIPPYNDQGYLIFCLSLSRNVTIMEMASIYHKHLFGVSLAFDSQIECNRCIYLVFVTYQLAYVKHTLETNLN